MLKFNHFLFKNAFGIHRSFRKTCFGLSWIFSLFGVQTSVLLGLTPFFVKNCVLLKFNHFLFKNAFGVHRSFRKTSFVLSCIFSIFGVQTSVLQGFTQFCVKNCVLLKFNHFLFKNAFGMHCRFRKTSFVLTWISSIFGVQTSILLGLAPFFVKKCVLLKFNHFLFKNAFRIICRIRKTFLVLNWIFQYFVLKAASYVVLHNFVSKTAFC